MHKVSEIDKAYLAGLIDGEGCIGVSIKSNKSLQVALEVCMTTPAPLRWAHHITGCGNVYKCKVVSNHRPTYKWVVGNNTESGDVVRSMLPYLKVKGAQARIFSALTRLRTLNSPGKPKQKFVRELEIVFCRCIHRLKTI